MQQRRATSWPVHAAWRTMHGGLGSGRPARDIALIGLGITVAVLVSCSGESGGSRETATPRAQETIAASARPEEPNPPSSDDHRGGPPRTTEPARGGSIHQTVDPARGVIARPVGIDEVAEFGRGVQARLGPVEAITVEGHLPGERSGPAVAVSVEVTNGSPHTIDLDTVTVDLVTGDGLSAYGVVVPDRPPLAGDLPAGEATSGEYVFTLAPEDRTDVQVRIKYSADTPTVVFEGSVADG